MKAPPVVRQAHHERFDRLTTSGSDPYAAAAAQAGPELGLPGGPTGGLIAEEENLGGGHQPLQGVRKGLSVALQNPLSLLEEVR